MVKMGQHGQNRSKRGKTVYKCLWSGHPLARIHKMEATPIPFKDLNEQEIYSPAFGDNYLDLEDRCCKTLPSNLPLRLCIAKWAFLSPVFFGFIIFI